MEGLPKNLPEEFEVIPAGKGRRVPGNGSSRCEGTETQSVMNPCSVSSGVAGARRSDGRGSWRERYELFLKGLRRNFLESEH